MADCKAQRTDGSKCQAHALRGGDFCFFHDPDSRTSMIEAARKGGTRRTVELPECAPLRPERARAILGRRDRGRRVRGG